MRVGAIEPLTYLQKVNKDNIEEQKERNVDNLVLARELQIQMNDLREMERGYNISKLPLAQTGQQLNAIA